jgi:predicted nucleic acid-binding protein
MIAAQQLAANSRWTARLRRPKTTRYPVVSPVDRMCNPGGLSAYHGSYVALAELLGCSLLAADGPVSQALGICCSFMLVPCPLRTRSRGPAG